MTAEDLTPPDQEQVDNIIPPLQKVEPRPPGIERRRAPRCKVNLQAYWEGDKGQHRADVTSLSANGCFVLSGGEVRAKELIRLEILLPNDEPIHLWAEVVDQANEIGFAMQFTSVEPTEQARLQQFLQGCLARQG